MQDKAVSKADSDQHKAPRFTTFERVVLASGVCALSIWLCGLAWVGYKLMAFII